MIAVANNALFSYRLDSGRPPFDSADPLWKEPEKVSIDAFWDGRQALEEIGINWNNLTRVASRWNENALFFYFECWFDRLYVFEGPRGRVDRLWERDVAEVFLQPDASGPYFELEISPLGQWLDFCVYSPREKVDKDWRSEMKVTTFTDEDAGLWEALLEVPLDPILSTSGLSGVELGDTWKVNLFRIAGREPAREYLSWQPTGTAEPDFHVPKAFGHLIFVDQPVDK